MASSQARVSQGELAKYEIIGDLAMGGMAELFLARSTGIEGFEKVVALKRILPQLAGNGDFVRMFLDEARIAACLAHPNIAQVYDIGHDGDSYFFTMEYVHGKDLRHVLYAAGAAGGLPLEHALYVIHGVAAGLHYAHEKLDASGRCLEIVHRDVSPANVIVTFDGGVKLVDFGVAKARSRNTETQVGTLKGKIAYMSPEQCRGEPVDRRSDVFALGILLYELTTGTRLFTGETEFALITKVANHEVPLPSLRQPGYPRGLELIVMKALAALPEDRYPSAEAVLEDIERFAHSQRLSLSAVTVGKYMRLLFRDAAALAAGPGGGFATGSGQTSAARRGTVEMDADLPSQVVLSPSPVACAPVAPEAEPPVARRPRLRMFLTGVVTVLALGAALVLLRPNPDQAQPRGSAPSSTVATPIAPAMPPSSPVAVTPAPAVPPSSPVVAPTPPPTSHGHRHSSSSGHGHRAAPAAPWDPDSPFLPPR